MLHVSALGEIYYIRMLLFHTPTTSLEALRGRHSTFQEAANAAGLLPEGQEAILGLHEARLFSAPPQRRELFMHYTLENFPTMHIFNTIPELRASLYEDWIEEFTRGYLDQAGNGAEVSEAAILDAEKKAKSLADKKLLSFIAKTLQGFGKTAEDYGFPEPDETFSTELEDYRRQCNFADERNKLRILHETSPHNARQKELYDIITRAIDRNESLLIFLQGQGGSGKTTFAKKIIAYTRSRGKVVLGCASTGLACQVYEEGQFVTAHSLFEIPVYDAIDDFDGEEDAFASRLHSVPRKLELVQEASVIIWDEILRYATISLH